MYSRRVVKDYETVMNKELYDNLQDGIDESKQAISELEESLAETKQDFSSQIQQGMGGIRYDPSRDMIIVQNPYTGKWIDWQETGKLVKPSTITITTETLKGEQVTLTIGDETYTSFFDQSDGTATFTVYSSGEATVTCGEYSMTITIDEKGGVTSSGSLETETCLYHSGAVYNGALTNGLFSVYLTKYRGFFVNKELSLKFCKKFSGKLIVYISASNNQSSVSPPMLVYPNGYCYNNSTGDYQNTDYEEGLELSVPFDRFASILSSYNFGSSDIKGFEVSISSSSGSSPLKSYIEWISLRG